MPDYKEILEQKLPLCEKCREVMEENEGTILIEGNIEETRLVPRMWKHSELDLYHAWIRVNDRHIFLCGSDEFDELTLKRIRPLKREDINSWTVAIHGKTYHVIEGEDSAYEILNDDGTIVKDEEIEAKVFNHMVNIRQQ